MSFDFSSLSSDPLFYFLTHSTVFVAGMASVFFIFGLAFGWLTWARYKSQRRELLAECELLKDEIATLKRKLAEQIARASLLPDAAPSPESPPPRPAHAEPDPVINSFLTTAAAFLPQTQQPTEPEPLSDPLPEAIDPRHSSSESTHVSPRGESKRARKPSVTSKVKPKAHPLHSVIHQQGGDNLVDHAGGDHGMPHIPSSSPAPAAEAQFQGDSRLISDPHLGLIYASRPGLSDDLSQLKGVASVIKDRLNDYGVYTFKQIALWSEENIHEFSRLLAFKERIHREQWVEQARELHFQKYGDRL